MVTAPACSRAAPARGLRSRSLRRTKVAIIYKAGGGACVLDGAVAPADLLWVFTGEVLRVVHDQVGACKKLGVAPVFPEKIADTGSKRDRMRFVIARALTLEPELIFAEEPVSAQDVSVQAQVLLLLKDLQAKRGLAFVFVSHELGVVRWFCTRVAVMYLGRVVEQGPVARVFSTPRRPYTRMLRDGSPIPDPSRRGELPRVTGERPSAADPPPGCHFHPRCPRASDLCRSTFPAWSDPDGHGFPCHHPLEC